MWLSAFEKRKQGRNSAHQGQMYSKVSALSDFVLAINSRATSMDVSDLVAYAVEILADTLGYDSAWYGWAQIDPDETVIHASTTLNLPSDYFDVWTGMADQDVLVTQFLSDPHSVPTYDRFGERQTDGMEFLADRFGIHRMATAMCLRHDRTASFFLSAYRAGQSARIWSQEDREFLQCAVDNISAVARLAVGNGQQAAGGKSTSAYLSRQGAMIVGLANMRDRFGDMWPCSDGDSVPDWLTEYVQDPGEHVLADRELIVRCERVGDPKGFGWRKLSIRPLQKFDLLSPRERDVARALANGQSHKTAAKLLGIAPATVRNQTQSIYRKLGVDNRADLARHVLHRVT